MSSQQEDAGRVERRGGSGGAAVGSVTHVPALDGARGVAVLLVMVFHFGQLMNKSYSGLPLPRILSNGWIGVDLFFVLSGFLITGILLDGRQDRFAIGRFYVRRILRIFPLYYGVLALVFVALPLVPGLATDGYRKVAEHQAWLWLYASNVRMSLEGVWGFRASWVSLNHFWSLAVEEHFYFMWPFLVFFARRYVLHVSLAIVVAALVLRVASLGWDAPYLFRYTFTSSRIDSIAMGALAAALMRTPAASVLPVVARRVGTLAVAIIIGAALWRGGLRPDDSYVNTFGFTVLAVASMCLLVSIVDGRSTLARALSFAPLRSVGKYSYGSYVFHVALMPLYARAWKPALQLEVAGWRAGLIGTALIGTCVAATLVVSWLSWHLFERHFLDLKERWAPR